MANRICMLREMQGLSFADIASKMGVSENTVRRWETGFVKNIPDEKVLELAEFFEVTPAFLLGWPEKVAGKDQPA